MRIRNQVVMGSVIAFGALATVSWAPTSNTDSVVIGTNSIINTGTTRNLIIGTGVGNAGKINTSVVVGDNNQLSNAPTGDAAQGRSIVAGYSNAVDASNSLVVGASNTVNSVTSLAARESAALGSYNQINNEHACVIGYGNIVNGNWSTALGTWLSVDHDSVCAVGKYNAFTESGDVFVVGTGTADSSRDTSLKTTTDGSVILGSATRGKVVLARAQGDISMGQYTN